MVSFPERTLAVHRTREVKGERPNVHQLERWASLFGGAALTLYALRRRDRSGAVLALAGAALVERGATGHCRVYHALGVTTNADEGSFLERKRGRAAVLDASKAVRVERSVTIARSPEQLYAFWRDFRNLPRVMQHLEDVTLLDGDRSRWRAKAPAGQSVEWEAEIINEVPNELIAWRSVAEATVPNAGSVHFTPAPGGRGTVLRVIIEYEPPAGLVGSTIARFVHEEPDAQVREDLRRFKRMMETGETPTTEGQPSGRR